MNNEAPREKKQEIEGYYHREYYHPSGTMEFTDGENWFNSNMDPLRNPSEYDDSSEGYTPFGDE